MPKCPRIPICPGMTECPRMAESRAVTVLGSRESGYRAENGMRIQPQRRKEAQEKTSHFSPFTAHDHFEVFGLRV